MTKSERSRQLSSVHRHHGYMTFVCFYKGFIDCKNLISFVFFYYVFVIWQTHFVVLSDTLLRVNIWDIYSFIKSTSLGSFFIWDHVFARLIIFVILPALQGVLKHALDLLSGPNRFTIITLVKISYEIIDSLPSVTLFFLALNSFIDSVDPCLALDQIIISEDEAPFPIKEVLLHRGPWARSFDHFLSDLDCLTKLLVQDGAVFNEVRHRLSLRRVSHRHSVSLDYPVCLDFMNYERLWRASPPLVRFLLWAILCRNDSSNHYFSWIYWWFRSLYAHLHVARLKLDQRFLPTHCGNASRSWRLIHHARFAGRDVS